MTFPKLPEAITILSSLTSWLADCLSRPTRITPGTVVSTRFGWGPWFVEDDRNSGTETFPSADLLFWCLDLTWLLRLEDWTRDRKNICKALCPCGGVCVSSEHCGHQSCIHRCRNCRACPLCAVSYEVVALIFWLTCGCRHCKYRVSTWNE